MRNTPLGLRAEKLEGEKIVAVVSAAALALLVILPLVFALFVESSLAAKFVECGKDFGLISLGAFGGAVYAFLGGSKKERQQ